MSKKQSELTNNELVKIIRRYGSLEEWERSKKRSELGLEEIDKASPASPASSVRNEGMNMNRISQGVVVGFGLSVGIGIGVWAGTNVTSSPDELPGGGDPNLYELARQSAENTRYIFILLCAGWMCLFGFYLPYISHKNLY